MRTLRHFGISSDRYGRNNMPGVEEAFDGSEAEPEPSDLPCAICGAPRYTVYNNKPLCVTHYFQALKNARREGI